MSKGLSIEATIWKAILSKNASCDRVVINGNSYEIRSTENGFQAWAQDSGHWLKITEFSEMTHDDCLRDIISNAYWRLRS